MSYCTSSGLWWMMSVQDSVECLSGETDVLGDNLAQFRFAHHKSHMTWTVSNPSNGSANPVTCRLSYSKAWWGTRLHKSRKFPLTEVRNIQNAEKYICRLQLQWFFSRQPLLFSIRIFKHILLCKIWGFHGRWLWRMASSRMLRRVALVRSDVSEELTTSFIRMTRID
jgi:hypothetical protein